MTDGAETLTEQEKGPDSSRKNERSSIEFPYGDLDAAVSIAKTMYAESGSSCTPEQLASFLSMAPNSGGFRSKIAPARLFGLLEVERGKIIISGLGKRIVDPSTERSARVDAFLRVPLYKALYDRYKSSLLPSTAGLEREIATLGVSSKQADKARQVFERSATQAGFFERGRDRLVIPIIKQDEEVKPPNESTTSTPNIIKSSNTELDPIIQALVDRIPKKNSSENSHDGDGASEEKGGWPVPEQVQWLQMMSMAFNMVFRNDEGKIRIEFVSKKLSEA